MQISRGKPGVLRRAPAGSTALVLDGYGLRDLTPARPTSPASYPVAVRQVATLLHASFRRFLAVPPLRFASASPPSGCTGDFHPQDAGHARHTCAMRPKRPSPLTKEHVGQEPSARGAVKSRALLRATAEGGLDLTASTTMAARRLLEGRPSPSHMCSNPDGTTADAVAASAGWLRQSLTSNSLPAP
jgi:hypothetical protein